MVRRQINSLESKQVKVPRLSLIAVAFAILVAGAFSPLLPCGARPLTREEKEVARGIHLRVSDEFLSTWRIPCGADGLGIEDRVRVAEIVRRHGSDMRMLPVVMRIEFHETFITPRGGKAYDFVGRTFFFAIWNKMRVIESGGCGRVIGGGESFGQEVC